MIAAREKADHFCEEFQASAPIETRAVGERSVRLFLMAMVVAAFALGVAFSYANALAVTVGYQAEGLGAEIERLKTENQSLRTAVDKLDSLPRVEFLAVTQLGMVRPTPGDVKVVFIDGGKTTGGTNTVVAAATIPGKGLLVNANTVSDLGPDESERQAEARESGVLQAFLDLVAR